MVGGGGEAPPGTEAVRSVCAVRVREGGTAPPRPLGAGSVAMATPPARREPLGLRGPPGGLL